MPIPQPGSGEDKDAFVGRCISFLADEDPSMPNDQRVAICLNTWRRSTEEVTDETHTDFKKILRDFVDLLGKKKGKKKYDEWLQAYRLDPTKSYSSQITRECLDGICESFQWAKPMIQFLKEDEGGKFYKVRALTATVSMNNNDYSGQDTFFDISRLERSARTLIYRPLNINHDHSRRLPFPENRVDWAEHEDNTVEAIIRIDNSQRGVQRQIESGDIVNPSIEAIPRGGKRIDGRFVPDMWNFTELALLEKDETLPGVPTTFGIEPLFLNEGMAERLVESLSMEIEEKEENNMSETPTEECTTHKAATKEELKEYWGINNLTVCGQCKFFEMQAPVNTRTPAVTGAESDAFNTSSVGLGLGVGVCHVLENLRGTNFHVKMGDWACSDGRPREDPILVNRGTQNVDSHESLDEVKTSAELIEEKRKNADKTEELAKAERDKQTLREDKSKLAHELIDSRANEEKQAKTISEQQSKIARLEVDRSTLREDNDKLKDSQAEYTVELERKDKDIVYFKEQADRYKEDSEETKKELVDSKAKLTLSYEKLNDETEKRASNAQSLRNAEEAKARLQTEISELHIKISEMTRQISDYAQNNSDLAKARIKDTEEVTSMRKERDELEETLRDTRRELNKAKTRPTKIKVMV